MKNSLKLTVNVITYNHEKYIKECLDSILRQKTDFDFIIRIFDDASTDKTQEICKSYKEKYPEKIELYLAEKNLGKTPDGTLINALRSYENITTPYFIFIEGDDYYYDKRAFQYLSQILDKNKDCICACGLVKILDDTSKKMIYTFPQNAKEIISLKDAETTSTYFHVQHSGKMIRTSAINIDKENPIYFCFDITQKYELLLQGNIHIGKRVVSVYRFNQCGVYSQIPFIDKTKFLFTQIINYNNYRNKRFEENLLSNLVCELNSHYYFSYNKNAFKYSEGQQKYRLKNIKHYFIPRFILDIFDLPRDLSRFLRKTYKKMRGTNELN